MRNLILYSWMYTNYLIQSSILFTGTKKLFGDLLVAFQIVLIPIVVALYVFWEIQKRTGDDTEDSRFTKKQKGAIIGLIIAELISSLIGIIGGYYGLSLG